LHERLNISPHIFLNGFKLVPQIHRVDQQKAAWFESNFCVSCASCITIDNRQWTFCTFCLTVANIDFTFPNFPFANIVIIQWDFYF